MRERITFAQKQGNAVDPATLKIAPHSLEGPDLEAAREDRITLSLDELPAELRDLVRDTRELHIRWVSQTPYESVGPYVSRLPPGLHVFFTPATPSQGQQQTVKHDNGLCRTLTELFGPIRCTSPFESFTALPTHRFTHSAAFQYFQQLDSLDHFARHFQQRLCPADDASCRSRAAQLAAAASLDISYDAVSGALKAAALWPHQTRAMRVAAARPPSRTEVGILAQDAVPNLEPHEIGISGLLAVLDEDARPPGPTMFQVSTRHRDAAAAFDACFLEPAGLHPILRLRLESARPPPAAKRLGGHCAPHAYLALPSGIFADRYQLGDGLFLASKNLSELRYMSEPVDLEAPDYAMRLWGSSVLLELAAPETAPEGPLTAEIPLHLRYLPPAPGGYADMQVPYPAVVWACTVEGGEARFNTNPFERVNLGYDGLFDPQTVFWHVNPRPVGPGDEAGKLVSTIKVPVLDMDKAGWVNAGTALVILLGFAWVSWKLFKAYAQYGHGGGPRQVPTPGGDKKKQ